MIIGLPSNTIVKIDLDGCKNNVFSLALNVYLSTISTPLVLPKHSIDNTLLLKITLKISLIGFVFLYGALFLAPMQYLNV